MLYFTGTDQELGNILTFGIGFFSAKTTISMWWVLNKFIEKCQLVKKPLRTVYAPIDKKLFPLLQKELPHQCSLYATTHSVIEKVREITSEGSAIEVQDKVLKLFMDICQTDTADATKSKLREVKSLLEPHFEAYKKYLKRIHATKKMWLLQHLNSVFTGGQHSYNRSATISRQLQSKIMNENASERTARCECT